MKSGKKLPITFFLMAISMIMACQSLPPEQTSNPTRQPLLIPTEPSEVDCADIDLYWGNDWPHVINVLQTLEDQAISCGPEPLASKLYAAYFNNGVQLEAAGDNDAAVKNYTAAFLLDGSRREALDALIRLDTLPEPTITPCLSESEPQPDPAAVAPVDAGRFLQLNGNGFILNGEPFIVRGVNYYPRHAPWHRFLSQSDPAEIEQELTLIAEAGFNTIRIFLWYDPLFTCQPEDAIPNEAAFALVDHVIEQAQQRDLKLIVTLNDLPDLTFRPLYRDWARYDAQTTYIVRRYRHEPAIIAWDLRNEGDLDYGARPGDDPRFTPDEVLSWLAHAEDLVRQHDPHHLITAGWWGDPLVTAEHVDFLSFHHWADSSSLQERLAEYPSDQPILLEEVGYHSWGTAPQDARDEATQGDLLRQVIQTAENSQLAGWLVWTAFDFEPDPGQPINYEHRFGLWRSDLTPKPAVQMVQSTFPEASKSENSGEVTVNQPECGGCEDP